MFKELSSQEIQEVTTEAIKAVETLQNHFIALALKGNNEVKSQELLFRSMKVGLQQGCTKANIEYMRDKLQLASIFIK